MESPTTLSRRLYDHPWIVAGVAVALAIVAIGVVTYDASWEAVASAFTHLSPVWLAVCAGAHLLAMLGYVAAYRSLVALYGGERMPLRLVATIVMAGFGAFAAGGGFRLDQRAIEAFHGDRRVATVFVIALGTLEYALLAPAATACAVALLVTGANVQGALLWPWVIAVPVGFALGLWLSRGRFRQRIERRGRLRTTVRDALDGVAMLRTMLRHPLRASGAWLGSALYWTAEIGTLYAALRLFGAEIDTLRLILAYATGYAATRRTLPLGGAGITEALLCIALVWVGLPLARAIPAVVAYRGITFLLPIFPTVRSHWRLRPLLHGVERSTRRR